MGRAARGPGRRRRAACGGRRDGAVAGSALGWGPRGRSRWSCGQAPPRGGSTDLFDEVRRVAQTAGLDALCAVQGERLVVILGGVKDPRKAATVVVTLFGDGPVVVGPVADDLGSASVSARAAISGQRAASGWPDAPRPVLSNELLPERALAGDGHARRHLVDEIYLPLVQARGALDRDGDRVAADRGLDRGHGSSSVLSPQHRALPAQAGRRGHRSDPGRSAGRLHARDRARPGAAVRAATSRGCAACQWGTGAEIPLETRGYAEMSVSRGRVVRLPDVVGSLTT